MTPVIQKASRIEGRSLVFRDACESDAAFIYELRSDRVRARYLSAVPPQLQAQVEWLRGYAKDQSQAYFVMCDADNYPLGTVRLYGARGTAFCWGSWLLRGGLPARYGIESALMVYRYALWLGFDSAWFEVHKENSSVWRFHENFGAQRTGETHDSWCYELAPAALQSSLEKYKRYLPDGIRITPLEIVA